MLVKYASLLDAESRFSRQVGKENRPAGDTYGVLSTSTTSLQVAYPATAGWDFATGLGTVNVTNLVNSW